MKFIKTTFFSLMFLCMAFPISAAKKTIHVIPDNATIYCNGMEVGTGIFEIKFGRNDDFIMLKFEAPGYISRTVKLHKAHPKKTVSYTLHEDKALKNSIGQESGFDLANKNFTIICKEGMSQDVVWKRLMNIAINNFEQVEIRDQAAGWIRTGWAKHSFISGNEQQVVRTRLEIKMQFASEGEQAYRVKITSEKAEGDNITEESFLPYDRVLKKYENLVSELQTSLGASL